MAVAAYAAMRDLPGNERERGHVAAVGHLIAGELRGRRSGAGGHLHRLSA